MKKSVYQCACGKVKGDANNWLLGCTAYPPRALQLVTDARDAYALMPWDDEVAQQFHVEHFCGMSCALKRQAEVLGHRSAAPEATAVVLDEVDADR